MTADASTRTAASDLTSNPEVSAAIDVAVAAIQDAQAGLTGARPPVEELATPYESLLKRLDESRGKASLYPYVGSGLGNGPLVELADGSVKWDMIGGIGVHMFGHSDPDLVGTAMRAAMSDTIMQGNLQCNVEAIEFAELLLTEAGCTSDLMHCFITNSGAIANESALKVCFQRNAPAERILSFSGYFAGRTTAMAQLTDNPSGRVSLPLNMHVDYVPFFDPTDPEGSTAYTLRRLDEYIKRYPGGHACFVMELVQGEGGFNVAPRTFIEPLMRHCRDAGIGVWVDEVQTFGRTNQMFHFEQLGVGELVDVVTIGKMSQVCACLFTAAYNPQPGLLSGTFIGSTVGLKIGHRSLQRMRDGGYYGNDGRIARLYESFTEHMEGIAQRHPDWFPSIEGASPDLPRWGGVGGMMRFTPFGGCRDRIKSLLDVLFELGVIAFYCGHGPYHVRFLPPVGIMQPEHFEEVFEIIEAAMERVARESA